MDRAAIDELVRELISNGQAQVPETFSLPFPVLLTYRARYERYRIENVIQLDAFQDDPVVHVGYFSMIHHHLSGYTEENLVVPSHVPFTRHTEHYLRKKKVPAHYLDPLPLCRITDAKLHAASLPLPADIPAFEQAALAREMPIAFPPSSLMALPGTDPLKELLAGTALALAQAHFGGSGLLLSPYLGKAEMYEIRKLWNRLGAVPIDDYYGIPFNDNVAWLQYALQRERENRLDD